MVDEEKSSSNYQSPFDTIRHTDEHMHEYWSARELHKILGYTEWRNFNNVVIKRAMKACGENGRAVSDHFVRSYKVIMGGKGAKQNVVDVLLSRYAAYLVVMNGDPNMLIVAMGQEYFAEQTRRQELVSQGDTMRHFLRIRSASTDVQNFPYKMSILLIPLVRQALLLQLIFQPFKIMAIEVCIHS